MVIDIRILVHITLKYSHLLAKMILWAFISSPSISKVISDNRGLNRRFCISFFKVGSAIRS